MNHNEAMKTAEWLTALASLATIGTFVLWFLPNRQKVDVTFDPNGPPARVEVTAKPVVTPSPPASQGPAKPPPSKASLVEASSTSASVDAAARPSPPSIIEALPKAAQFAGFEFAIVDATASGANARISLRATNTGTDRQLTICHTWNYYCPPGLSPNGAKFFDQDDRGHAVHRVTIGGDGEISRLQTGRSARIELEFTGIPTLSGRSSVVSITALDIAVRVSDPTGAHREDGMLTFQRPQPQAK